MRSVFDRIALTPAAHGAGVNAQLTTQFGVRLARLLEVGPGAWREWWRSCAGGCSLQVDPRGQVFQPTPTEKQTGDSGVK